MAGVCAGPGLTDEGGLLALYGARAGEPPCDLDTYNGLRVDGIGRAWTAPDQPNSFLLGVPNNADRTQLIDGPGPFYLGTTIVEMAASECNHALFRGEIIGGHAGWRAADGNFWMLRRFVHFEVDNTTVGFTGLQDVGGVENNSGGIISQVGPVESSAFYATAGPGQVFRMTAEWTIDVLAYSASAVNLCVWRFPQMAGSLFEYPAP